jgi:hypothetical protein
LDFLGFPCPNRAFSTGCGDPQGKKISLHRFSPHRLGSDAGEAASITQILIFTKRMLGEIAPAPLGSLSPDAALRSLREE